MEAIPQLECHLELDNRWVSFLGLFSAPFTNRSDFAIRVDGLSRHVDDLSACAQCDLTQDASPFLVTVQGGGCGGNLLVIVFAEPEEVELGKARRLGMTSWPL